MRGVRDKNQFQGLKTKKPLFRAALLFRENNKNYFFFFLAAFFFFPPFFLAAIFFSFVELINPAHTWSGYFRAINLFGHLIHIDEQIIHSSESFYENFKQLQHQS
jgi:hypothetical protein